MTLGQRLIVVLKVVAVFILLGPPIGAATMFAGIGVYGAMQTGDVADVLWLTLFGMIYGAPLSYFIGFAPAAIAGAILGVIAVLHRVPGFLMAVAVGTIVGVGLLYSSGSSLAPPANDDVTKTGSDLLLVASCVVPTAICWMVARCIFGRSNGQPA